MRDPKVAFALGLLMGPAGIIYASPFIGCGLLLVIGLLSYPLRHSSFSVLVVLLNVTCAFANYYLSKSTNESLLEEVKGYAQEKATAAVLEYRKNVKERQGGHRIEQTVFGRLPDGRTVLRYTLKSAFGLVAHISDYGGRVVSFMAPDRRGKMGESVVGYDGIGSYVTCPLPLGGIIGGCGTGTAGLTDSLGLASKLWDGAIEDESLCLRCVATGGEPDDPATISALVRYRLDDQDFVIEYEVSTDKEVRLFLTNYLFWKTNTGIGNMSMNTLSIRSDQYFVVDGNLSPLGRITSVEGTGLDFVRARTLFPPFRSPVVNTDSGEDSQVKPKVPEITFPRQFSNHFVLMEKTGKEWDGVLSDPDSGRNIAVSTTLPCLYLDNGEFGDVKITDRNGDNVMLNECLGLIPCDYPCPSDLTSFMPTTLQPGQTHYQKTVYRFGIRVSENLDSPEKYLT